MPLDFDLIKNATEHSLHSFTNKSATLSPALYRLENFLSTEILEKLNSFIVSDINWLPQEGIVKQYVKNRQKINWYPESVVEELHIVFENITPFIDTWMNRAVKFNGISLWRDTANFNISEHTDNPIIEAAIQIYLTESNINLGTVFDYQGQKIEIEYKRNHGYLMDNSSKPVHYMKNTVPNNHVRYSIHAIWIKT